MEIIMDITVYKVKLKFTEDLLGTVPKNKEIYKAFIATKAASREDAEEEVATVAEIEEKGWTGFHTDEKGPFLYDYSVKGFLCEAARTLKQHGALKQLMDKFKRYTFVTPRKIYLPKIAQDPNERPLRALTAQGPRVALVRSDVVPAGSRIEFQLKVLDQSGIKLPLIKEVLEYGSLMGLGQWRSGGFGRFEV